MESHRLPHLKEPASWLANGKMMMMIMLKPFHASEFFLHRLFAQPFYLFSPFLPPFHFCFLPPPPPTGVCCVDGGGLHLALFNQGSAGGGDG